MPKFFNNDIADLAQQLTRAPHRLRMEQVRGIEKLLGLIEPDRAYPFDFVCYHITKYRKRRSSTGFSIPGTALVSDLVTMAEVITRKANLPVNELQEPFKTQQQIAEELDVSTKTIRRWRSRGLMGIRAVFEDGVNRLAFLQRTIDRFVRQNGELVSKGAAFRQLTESERCYIVERTRELVSQRPLKLHAAARIIAEETDRAVETIRYTLRRYDAANPTTALFANNGPAVHSERHLAMWRCREAGEAPASIAQAFDCPVEEVERGLRQVQVQKWAQMRWEPIPNELFDAPNADVLILETPEPKIDASVGAARVQSRGSLPGDLPPYLRSLYRTPLLTPEQERDLFRRCNYLKYKIAKTLSALDPEELTKAQYETLRDLVFRADVIKQRIIRANLRLVVSIAKKHVGWSPNFFEVVSDGNMSLIRAVEGFDYARGTRFSTYATWAIMKNYARSIPQEHYHGSRYATGHDEILSQKADPSAVPSSESDQQRIRELIAAGMSELTGREREIVSGHFGLGGRNGSVTLEQLGQRFGVTKERIRQIELRALARLRDVLAPSLVEALAE